MLTPPAFTFQLFRALVQAWLFGIRRLQYQVPPISPEIFGGVRRLTAQILTLPRKTLSNRAPPAFRASAANQLTVKPKHFVDVDHGNVLAIHPSPARIEDRLKAVTNLAGVPAFCHVCQTRKTLMHPAAISVQWQGFNAPPIGQYTLGDFFAYAHDL